MLTLYVLGGDLRYPLSLALNQFGRIDGSSVIHGVPPT
jgi:hypothetical protein